MTRRLCVLVVMLVSLLGGAPRDALATPTFPAVIASELGLDSPPDCSLCHVGTPARGTVVTPFGTTIRSRGAQAHDEDSLRTALAAISAEKKDSDSDGTADVDELRADASPNGAANDVVPMYGCGVSRRPAKASSVLSTVAALAALVALATSWGRRLRASRDARGAARRRAR